MVGSNVLYNQDSPSSFLTAQDDGASRNVVVAKSAARNGYQHGTVLITNYARQ